MRRSWDLWRPCSVNQTARAWKNSRKNKHINYRVAVQKNCFPKFLVMSRKSCLVPYVMRTVLLLLLVRILNEPKQNRRIVTECILTYVNAINYYYQSGMKLYTAGHDYLDGERANCPMKTHWNTVWSNRQSKGAFPLFLNSVVWLWQFRVSRYRVRTPVKATFYDVTPMTTHTDQSIKLFKKIFSIDWPLQKVERRKKSEKIILTGIRTPGLET